VTITAIHTCNHCGRRLKHQPVDGLGPTCRRNLLGAKPKRVVLFPHGRLRQADPRQLLIPGVAV
jgi:hypothetical protein